MKPLSYNFKIVNISLLNPSMLSNSKMNAENNKNCEISFEFISIISKYSKYSELSFLSNLKLVLLSKFKEVLFSSSSSLDKLNNFLDLLSKLLSVYESSLFNEKFEVF